jgi:hypothetical protein
MEGDESAAASCKARKCRKNCRTKVRIQGKNTKKEKEVGLRLSCGR